MKTETRRQVEMDDEEREIAARLHQMIDDRCRITDDDFRLGLSMETETLIIERMTDEGYTVGRDEDGRNEFWPPDKPKRNCNAD